MYDMSSDSEIEIARRPSAIIGGVVKRAVSFDTGFGHRLPGMVHVECGYHVLQVDVRQAERNQKEFLDLLAMFGDAFSDESLRRGVTFSSVMEIINAGDVITAYVFAYGKAIGHWEVVTPQARLRDKRLRKVVFTEGEVGSIGIVRL